ncbi:MAG: WD40 repeat domain-containing protein [Nitrospirae bacterium]|nr:WD40 repeat domain-containing protein [Nitrospirota bacterium]MBF0540727.1 WD40 repeat domain-containing protein [Nitrospirota bacterium]
MKKLIIIIIVSFQILSCSFYSKQQNQLSLYNKGSIIDSPIHKTILGHSGSVEKVIFSPDGKIIASTGADKTIKIWDVSSGNIISTIKDAHNDCINSIAFSPDGKNLVSGGNDYLLKLWDVESGKLIKILGSHTSWVTDAAYSPDGKMIASGSSDKTIKLWDTKTGILFKTLIGHDKAVTSISFSPDGRYLASGSFDMTIKIWDTLKGKNITTLKQHIDEIDCVTYSHDGKYLVSSGRDNKLIVWETSVDISKPKLLLSISNGDNSIKTIAFSPDSATFATGSYDGFVKLWLISDLLPIATICKHEDWVRSIAFSPNGMFIVSGSVNSTIKLSGLPETYFYSYSTAPLTVDFDDGKEIIFPKGTVIKKGKDDIYATNNGIESKGILKESDVKPNFIQLYGSSNAIEIADSTPLYSNYDLMSSSINILNGTVIKVEDILFTLDKKLAYVTSDNKSGWISIKNIVLLDNVNFKKQLIDEDVPLLTSPKGNFKTKLAFGSTVNVDFYCPSLDFYFVSGEFGSGWIQGKFIK